jgi:hypothetical protein
MLLFPGEVKHAFQDSGDRVLVVTAVLLPAFQTFQSVALLQAVRGGEKADLSVAFVPGSVWTGNEVVIKPKPETLTLELTVRERHGDNYTAMLVWPEKSFHRFVEGTIDKYGGFTWKGQAGAPKPGHPHDGKINGNKIEFKVTPQGDGFETHGTLTLVLTPEKVDLSAAFIKGSVWKGDEVVTKPKPARTTWELTVLERHGDKYTAELVSTGNFRRRVEGTVKENGGLTWKGAVGERNPGHPHDGKVNGTKIEFKSTPKRDGVEAHGTFTMVPAGPRYDQIRQGRGPTCGFNATMAAMMHSGIDITKCITYKGNNRYEVKLHVHNEPGVGPVGGLHVETIPVDFDGKTLLAADPKITPGNKNEIWVVVIQRAMIEAIRRWNPKQSIEHPLPPAGGRDDVMAMLSGRLPKPIWVNEPDARQRVEAAIKAGKPLIYSDGHHVRAVLGATKDGLSLYDPYGYVVNLSWENNIKKGKRFWVDDGFRRD